VVGNVRKGNVIAIFANFVGAMVVLIVPLLRVSQCGGEGGGRRVVLVVRTWLE
jgi:hypothetical protein